MRDETSDGREDGPRDHIARGMDNGRGGYRGRCVCGWRGFDCTDWDEAHLEAMMHADFATLRDSLKRASNQPSVEP